jgi:flagellar hook-associated protein 2
MSVLRIGGIASGLDTEQIVRDLMRIERLKVDRLYQDKQLLEWKKEDFRGVINKVRAFRDTYFDYLNPQTNLISPATLKKRQVSSSDAGIVTATASADAAVGEVTFKVIQSATAARAASQKSSDEGVLIPDGVSVIKSSEEIASSVTITENKNILQVTLNGRTKEIAVSPGNKSLTELCGELQEGLDLAFGENRITVGAQDGRLSFEPAYASDLLTLSSSTAGADGDILAALNIASGATNRLNLTDTMGAVSDKLKNGTLVFKDESLTFKINNVDITVKKTDTLGEVLNKINNSDAGVLAAYSASSDILTITAQEIGNLAISADENDSNFFKAFGIEVDDEKGCIGEAGREAVFEINGIRGSRFSNNFTIDGITYNIREMVEEGNPQEVKISVSLDIDGIVENIEKFVEDYNELIDEINAKLREEVFRDFPPLTAEQKDAMQEKEIERWEEKARSGLLRRESSLENMLREMREAIYTAVDGVHIFEIGLETSNDYRDQGKLVLKDGGSTLRAALASDPDKVAAFFTRSPATDYSPDLPAAQRRERFKDAGLGHRLSDILNDNIRTTRDNNGYKGILLERAGIEGDISEFRNYFDRQIGEINKHIDRVNAALQRKEEQYYRQFTALEKAQQQLYSQGDWLMMQLSQFQS